MRLFVTGGNGFIGSVVVKKLIESGYEVRCLLRQTSETSRLENVKYERVYGDIRQLKSLEEGVQGCQGIIHLASLSNWNLIHSPDMDDIVRKGTHNILEAARRSGNVRTVFVSTCTAINGTRTPVIQNENSPFSLDKKTYSYAYAKHEAEQICAHYVQEGVPIVIVNPAEVYGPNDISLVTAGTLIDFARSSPVWICAGGTSVVYVEDVAMGIIKAFEKGRSGERYFLGGENLTLQQLAQLTLDLLGQKKSIIQLPRWFITTLAKIGKAFHLPLPFNPETIPYAVLYWFFDNAKARNELGVQFRSAKETLQPTLEWLRSTHLKL